MSILWLTQRNAAYQTEIDNLTKRSKSAENAFLNVYKVLAEAPDPYPLLEAAVVSTFRGIIKMYFGSRHHLRHRTKQSRPPRFVTYKLRCSGFVTTTQTYGNGTAKPPKPVPELNSWSRRYRQPLLSTPWPTCDHRWTR
jgi:hypothetical protein